MILSLFPSPDGCPRIVVDIITEGPPCYYVPKVRKGGEGREGGREGERGREEEEGREGGRGGREGGRAGGRAGGQNTPAFLLPYVDQEISVAHAVLCLQH